MTDTVFPNIRTIKLVNPREVIVCVVPKRNIEGDRSIFLYESVDHTENQYYQVMSRGDLVTEVEVGDVINMSFKKITPPIKGMLDGQIRSFGFAAADHIDFVVDMTDEEKSEILKN